MTTHRNTNAGCGDEKSAPAAEHTGAQNPVSKPMTSRAEPWKKRRELRNRLRLEGWPPRVAVPKELLDQLEQEADGKEVPP